MANVLIRDMPADLHRQLKAKAAAERRSLNQQILLILETSLAAEDKSREQRPRPAEATPD